MTGFAMTPHPRSGPLDAVAGEPAACDGCLGSRRCWVCLATGNADTQRGLGVCASCGGSGVCSYCDRRGQGRFRGHWSGHRRSPTLTMGSCAAATS